jgi:formiminoglutamase
LLNIQANAFTHPNQTLILGSINCDAELAQFEQIDLNKKSAQKKVFKLVEQIDAKVSFVVHQIIKSGKIPIIIGGGHNNAYGNLKGLALAKGQSINAINIDAHTDFRPEEGRHSGNGFSYAYSEGFLNQYFVLGLHENYTSEQVFKTIKKLKTIDYQTFESIKLRKATKLSEAATQALEFVSDNYFGIELDCDAIKNIPSSAQTPSGFSVNDARRLVRTFAQHQQASYLHICEAAPKSKDSKKVGKLITYLITDFIAAKQ